MAERKTEQVSVRVGSMRITREEARALERLVRARDEGERSRGSRDLGRGAWFRSVVRRLAQEAGVMKAAR